MPHRSQAIYRYLHLYLPILIFLTGCVSTDRANPLDPVGIAPVELLSAAFDSPRQKVHLVWTASQDTVTFSRYEIERKAVGVDTIMAVRLPAWADTSYSDAAVQPGVRYIYRVLVRNKAGLAVPSNAMSGQLGLPIQLFDPVFDSQTASAEVRWTRFQGDDFESYELERSSATTNRSLGVFQTSSDTSFTDTGLMAGELYSYRLSLQRSNGIRFQVIGTAAGF